MAQHSQRLSTNRPPVTRRNGMVVQHGFESWDDSAIGMTPGPPVTDGTEREDGPETDSLIRIGQDGNQRRNRALRLEVSQRFSGFFANGLRLRRVRQRGYEGVSRAIARLRNPSKRPRCGVASMRIRIVKRLDQRLYGAPVSQVFQAEGSLPKFDFLRLLEKLLQ